MTVYELNRAQMEELKQAYLVDYLDHWADEDETITYGDLANADLIVDDEVIYEAYAGTIFSEDDFACSAK